MPELPEVQTTVDDLNKKIKNHKILKVWSDWSKYFRFSPGREKFLTHIVGKKILRIFRLGKNILFELSDKHLMLIHQKLTGHLLVGRWKWDTRKKVWSSVNSKSPLAQPINQYIHLMFWLSGNKMMGLSDVRKFAKAIEGPREIVLNLPDLKDLGPNPMDPKLTFEKFRKLFARRGRIKQVLMDQNIISGIGNIYSDDILYTAKIHPLSRVEKLKESQISAIYIAMKKILKLALKLRGTSIDDYRTPSGESGYYQKARLVYQREGEKCPRGHIIKRLKLGGRSAHFCSKEQKLY